MENLAQHWFDWLILLGFLFGLIYTMKIIRKESASVLEESTPLSWRGLVFHIPRWWTRTRTEASLLQFERTDTRYDWYARFSWIPGGTDKELHQLLNEYVEREELDYDRDDVVLELDARVVIRTPPVQEYFKDFIRVEGKASQRIEERVYLDLCLLRAADKKGYFLFESRSSVLNGMVEGPFFEEVLAELELQA